MIIAILLCSYYNNIVIIVVVVVGRMFAVGLSQGPPHHYWYLWLDKMLPKTDLRTVALKILADQIFAAPFFACTFLVGMGILEDKKPSQCWEEFVKKFPAIYLVRNNDKYLILICSITTFSPPGKYLYKYFSLFFSSLIGVFGHQHNSLILQ